MNNNNNIIDEADNVRYAIKLSNGQFIGVPFATHHLAESTLLNLPEAQRAHASIVPVTSDGKEVLLG